MIAVFMVTLRRVPTPFADVQLYASIARSVHLHGVGIPSVIRNSPEAVDHIPFYGPVFFRLAAASFDAMGVSLRSIRIVSLLGALMLAGAAAMLGKDLSQSPNRWLWSFMLLLLTPELAEAATAGAMDSVAVGFEIAALALFVRGLCAPAPSRGLAVGAGLCLTFAALTTPRTYPFVMAFLISAAFLPWISAEARRARVQGGIVAAVLAIGIVAWATISHGSPLQWARYVTFIITHEDTDVALLPAAVRNWSFNWTSVLTPAFATVGACVAAQLLSRRRDASPDRHAGAAAFALLTGWMTLVVTVIGMNFTLSCGIYLALPLFATVIALPRRLITVDRRLVACAIGVLIACDAGLAALRYARVTATWAARDPEPLVEFFRAHVPKGAAVIGPEAPYFMAVERAGARYRSVSPLSWADWARWVPLIDPDAVRAARAVPTTKTRGRFVVWPADDELPAAYACARAHEVARYVPAPNNLHLLGWLGRRTLDVGYPKSVLYWLAPGCPTGYDPSRPQPVLSN